MSATSTSKAASAAPAVQPVPVTVKNLSKSFGSQQVLKDVSFSVDPGEIFVIMGPSGSGKSVLLKHIVGLLKPDSGEILIDNLDAGDPETHRKIVTSYVFQAGALFNSMTVFDNLALYPREHRLYDEKTIREKVHETMRILKLEGSEDKIPASLSGGMRKRVAIARSLVMEPQLLLYDEPTSELDPILAVTISEIIATVRKESKVTSIVVSHDRELALNIADKVALLINDKFIIDKPDAFRDSSDPDIRDFMNPPINVENPRFRRDNGGGH